MIQKDLTLDFNLYLCEKFGYRESCSVMSHANGFCVDIRERDLDCYIRFWEYSCGRGNFPDWSIIIVRSNFKKNQEESLKDLARFFKEYLPRYGYKYLCTEDDDYKYYQTPSLKCIMDGFLSQLCTCTEGFECLRHGLELRRGFFLSFSFLYSIIFYIFANEETINI